MIMAQGETDACIQQQTCCAAEINQLSACPEGNLLAAADDDGHVTTIQPINQGLHVRNSMAGTTIYAAASCSGNTNPIKVSTPTTHRQPLPPA